MAKQRLNVSSSVIERLNKIEDFSNGKLYGIEDDGELSILGFFVSPINSPGKDGKAWSINKSQNLLPHLPANVNILGVFNVGPAADLNEWENKCLRTQSKLTPVMLSIEPGAKAVVAKLWNEGKYEKATFEIVKDSYWKKFISLRVKGTFYGNNRFHIVAMNEAFIEIRRQVNEGACFVLAGTDVFLKDKYIRGPGITDKSDVQDLKSLMGSSNGKNNVMDFKMYLRKSYDLSEIENALEISCDKGFFKYIKMRLSIDALSLVGPKTKVSELYKIIMESISRSATLLQKCTLNQFTEGGLNPNKVSSPKIYHFLPQKCDHFISIAYPEKQMEDQLITTREIFHKALSLPMDIPIFRRGNAHSFVTVESPSKLIINPHEGLDASGVVSGEVSLVQGKYAYHHYMQDGFDDSGWGCAYRSLQTIFSWFRLQGFTGRSIPTHEEIQKCLVDIGDKPSSFIGSKNWIGSTEVSFVLETMLGVTSRIVSVSSGEELSMKGGELGHHFKTQGTPIMIGGGVLAHTILGVDYNRKTGSLKFLILDPHYTGDEDLSTIQAKGWCGWKGIDFWKKNAFYNMCLPLRPKSI